MKMEIFVFTSTIVVLSTLKYSKKEELINNENRKVKKGSKLEGGGVFPSYFVEQRGRKKCWRCGGPPWKKDCINPHQVIASNPSLSQPCSRVNQTKYYNQS
jgi:hypothetical protein